jgi:hypothetical protein
MTQRFPMIGMSPDVWGPFFWTTMHIVSLGYSPRPTEAEKGAAIKFYESLAYTIPCPVCREHYKHFLQEMPIQNAVGSRDELIDWVFTIHNRVNQTLGKPVISFDQYIQSMSALSKRSSFSIDSSTINTINTINTTAIITTTAIAVSVSAAIALYIFYHKSK